MHQCVPVTPKVTPRGLGAQVDRAQCGKQAAHKPNGVSPFGTNVLDGIIRAYRSKVSELSTLTEEFSKHCGSSSLRCTALTPPGPSPTTVFGISHRSLCLHSELPPLPTHPIDIDPSEMDHTEPISTELENDGDEHSENSSLADDVGAEEFLTALTEPFRIKMDWYGDAADCLQIDLATKSALTMNRTMSLDDTGNGVTQSLGSAMGYSGSYSSIIPEPGVGRRIVSSPADPKRILWEVFGIVLILYDLLEIPLSMALNSPQHLVKDVMDWVIRLFWTLNVPVALTTGFISDGVLNMSMRKICLHYCKTWLIVDIVTVIPDWLFLLLNMFNDKDIDDTGSDAGSLVRVLRFLRLLRIARLTRMTKLRDAWYMIYDTLDSEKVGILLEVLKNILLLMLVTHYIACMWFAIGSAQTGNSWLKMHRLEADGEDWTRQFLAAYHWSLTQFASSVDIYAQSESERLFAIGVVIFGMVGFSYLVGSITSSLARLQALNERRATSFWILRKYLKMNKVPHELCVRIRCYVESQWVRQEEMGDTNIDSLTLLSENLKSELACAIDGPALSIHPLFLELFVYLRGTIMRLMLSGISHLSLAPQDMMFTAGEDATHMSILTSGTMQYERHHLETSYPEVVDSGEDWVAEPVLWVSGWCHLGDLRSKTAAELLQVDPDKLNSIARLNPLAFAMMSSYSKEYAQWLNRFTTEYLSDITQGENVSTDLASIVEEISNKLASRGLGMVKASPPRKRNSGRFSGTSGSNSLLFWQSRTTLH